MSATLQPEEALKILSVILKASGPLILIILIPEFVSPEAIAVIVSDILKALEK